MTLSLSDAQALVDDWVHTVGVRYFSELTNTAILMEEVGEVARVMARRYGDQSNKPSDEAVELGEEMADVLFVLLCLANQTDIDLEGAFLAKMERRTQRDRERHQSNPKLHSKQPSMPHDDGPSD
jgi:NTP pyrophosphatase (non-canonical NTP hydrolase)